MWTKGGTLSGRRGIRTAAIMVSDSKVNQLLLFYLVCKLQTKY